METRRRLVDLYRFPGFRPRASVRGVFGDPQARVVSLERRGKKLFCSAWILHSRAIRRSTIGYEKVYRANG